jgi:tRNA (guanine10-N2)-dimethyltransferase
VQLLFELSKEHTSLPKDEILSCLKAENVEYTITESNANILIINGVITKEKINRIAERLSFTYFINELLFFSPPALTSIKTYAKNKSIEPSGSIAIKCKNRSNSINSQLILRELAKIFTKNREVNLRNPDIQVRVVITDFNVYVGLNVAEINRKKFEERKVQYRPFFSPISLHPKIARALVNLSEIKKNETMLDPCCGTGGLLLEGGLIGAKIIGGDIKEEMIEGCKKTLEFYDIRNYKLFCLDIGEISNEISNVDAVVTDLPYGKSTTTKGENIKNLYDRAFKTIASLLKKKKFAVIGLSNKDMIALGEQYFTLLNKYEYRVHRSLTRYFVVFKK